MSRRRTRNDCKYLGIAPRLNKVIYLWNKDVANYLLKEQESLYRYVNMRTRNASDEAMKEWWRDKYFYVCCLEHNIKRAILKDTAKRCLPEPVMDNWESRMAEKRKTRAEARGKFVIRSENDMTTAHRRALSDTLEYFLAKYGNTTASVYIGALHASLKFMEFTEYKTYVDESTMVRWLDKLVGAGHLVKGETKVCGQDMYGHADKVRDRMEDVRIACCDEAVDTIVEAR